MLRPFVGRWKSQGVASIMNIDDGIAGCSSKQQAGDASHSFHQSDLIRNAGWKANKQKSCWEPIQIGEWLRVIVNTSQTIFIVPEKKIRKAKAVSNGLLFDFPNVRVLNVACIRRFRDFFRGGGGGGGRVLPIIVVFLGVVIGDLVFLGVVQAKSFKKEKTGFC